MRLLGWPRVINQPMIWKEVFAEPGLRFGWMGWTCMALLVMASFLPPVFMYLNYLDHVGKPQPYMGGWSPRRILSQEMNGWCRGVGTLVSCLMFLAVAVRASGTVSGERDRQTLDGLLTSPLDSDNILFAKWLGSVLSVRWAWLWLLVIWTLTIATDGLLPIALPLILVCWLLYAGTFACVGLWYSMVSRTTLRATLWTLLTVVGIGGGHWLLTGMCCFMPLSIMARGNDKGVEYLAMFQAGQTPPFVLALLSFNGFEFDNPYGADEMWKLLFCSLVGVVCWGAGAAAMWRAASHRFRVLAGRQAFRPARIAPPDRRPPTPLAVEIQARERRDTESSAT
jgi:hypothetical protein